MASGAAVRAKVAAVLKRLNATSRVVKFRRIYTGGGDELLGIGVETAYEDTAVDPPPAVEQLNAEELSTGGGVYDLGDYRMTFAGTVAEDDLNSSVILYGDEVMKIITMEPYALNGIVVAWSVVARAMKAAV